MRKLLWGRIPRCGLGLVLLFSSAAQTPPPPNDASSLRRKIVEQGIAVEFSVEPGSPSSGNVVREGDPVVFRFNLSDAASGSPLAAAHPAAWLDRAAPGEVRSADLCEKKFRTFLSGGLGGTPDLNLNIYYAVTLNRDATLSVLDPLVGFGGSKLLAMVKLPGTGFDWALSADQAKLFVSLPEVNQVALVDTKSWAVAASGQVTLHPGRVAIQPDQQYLWVASEASGPDSADSGVTVFSVAGLKPAARIVTGRGAHEMEFSDDSRYAYISNSAQDTVSIVDTRTLRKIRDVVTGANPVSLAYSSKVGAVLVANRGDGSVMLLDAARSEPPVRMQTQPGISQIRFAPSGRYAFGVNPTRNEVYIIDAALQKVVQSFDVKERPDQVSFSETLAYIRHAGSEQVLMVPLDQIGEPGKPVPVVSFPAGKHAPGDGADSPAAGIVQATGENAVLVANPKDRAVYYYSEGMAAPIGTFATGGHEPNAVIVVDRSLRVRPGTGTYETTGIVGAPGIYDVVFFLDSPKIVHCFALAVSPNPQLEAQRGPRFDVRFAGAGTNTRAGEPYRVEFHLASNTGLPVPDAARDLSVLVFESPGMWRARVPVQAADGAGAFTAWFTPPRPGVYYVHVESGGIKLNPSGALILRAATAGGPAASPK